MNGAQEHDMKFDRKHNFYPLDKKTLIDLGKIFEPLDLNYCLYDNDYQFAKRDDHAIQRIGKNNLSLATFHNLEDIPDILYSKIMFIAPPEKKNAALALFNQHKIPHVRGFFSDPDLIEIVDENISKSYAIEHFCHQHGFTIANTMAFGDSTNDIEMLKDCGIGVCVSNGNPEAKAVADYITSSCDEDGVAHFLNDFLKLELTR
ncbi:MAG: HAD-superfamily hydrolase subfamily IIB [Erysipelotrichaceae bacterium]|nr:MAG: HAD-superfamily hydrolase subfamily [Erysipelotrichaceae bacterium]TXT16288.1 MAG: HAD-superfamily hydrolase subfamily IIB [Erysipelotrichaceae bacterium]